MTTVLGFEDGVLDGNMLRKVEVVRFEGDFPERSQLNDKGIVIYIPFKWNLRYVDLVLRIVYNKAAQQTTSASLQSKSQCHYQWTMSVLLNSTHSLLHRFRKVPSTSTKCTV